MSIFFNSQSFSLSSFPGFAFYSQQNDCCVCRWRNWWDGGVEKWERIIREINTVLLAIPVTFHPQHFRRFKCSISSSESTGRIHSCAAFNRRHNTSTPYYYHTSNQIRSSFEMRLVGHDKRKRGKNVKHFAFDNHKLDCAVAVVVWLRQHVSFCHHHSFICALRIQRHTAK